MRLKKDSVLAIVRYLAITTMTFVLVAFFALVTINISFLNPIARVIEDFSMTDLYYQAMAEGAPDTCRYITIVDMTDLQRRRDIAQIIDEIEAYNPKVVGVDIVFEGLKEDIIGDMMIEEVASKYTNIVFASELKDYVASKGCYTRERQSFFVDSVSVVEGYTNFEGNIYGGIKRKLSCWREVNGKNKYSFASQIFKKYAMPNKVDLHKDDMDVNYAYTHYPVVRFDSITFNPQLIEGQIVLFGATHEDTDMKYTPIGMMAGIKLHAYSLKTLISQKDIKDVSWSIVLPLSFLLVLASLWVREHYLALINKRSDAIKVFLKSDLMIGVFTFSWMVLLMGCAFLIFGIFGWSINMGLALSAIVFLRSATVFYDTCVKSLKSYKS